MSTQNIEFNDSGAVKRDYSNIDRRDEIIDAVTNDDDVDDDALPGEQASTEELQESRETVAEEPQPDRSHLPGTETIKSTWRGTTLEFDEDPTLMEQIEELTEDGDTSEKELRQWFIRKLDDLCTDPAADEEYWSQFQASRNDDKDGLADLLMDLTGAPDPEEVQQAQQFRNE